LKIKYTSQFKKDFKKVQKQNKDINKLQIIIENLQAKQKLEEKHFDHPLSGEWIKYRECHIAPDWLLIYKIEDNFLVLVRTGSHADLFKM
jgi:mRNA interferase YafQ